VIALFFAFPKQRRFPGCILGVMLVVDWLHMLREVIKASPIDSLQEDVLWGRDRNACGLLYIWVTWVEGEQFSLVISLSIIVYYSVVKKVDVSYRADPRYFTATASFITIYPILYTSMQALVIAYDGGYVHTNPYLCGPASVTPNAIALGQCVASIVIQTVLFVRSVKYIWAVVGSVQKITSKSRKRELALTIRFMLIVLFQTLPRIDFNVSYITMIVFKEKYTALQTMASAVMFLASYLVSTLVVVSGNKGLHKWIRKHYHRFIGNKRKPAPLSSSDSSSITPPHSRSEEEVVRKSTEMQVVVVSPIESQK